MAGGTEEYWGSAHPDTIESITNASFHDQSAAVATAQAAGLVDVETTIGAPQLDARAQWTSLAKPIFTGTAPPNTRLDVYATSAGGTALISEVNSDGTGHWSALPTVDLPEGANTISAVAHPANGLPSASIGTRLTIANSALSAPEIAAIAPTPACDGSITLTGFAAAGATVLIGEMVDGQYETINSTAADESGSFTIALEACSLGFGTQQLAVRQANTAWVESGWSTPKSVAVADPEAVAIHVGSDLAARLSNDATAGLDATEDLQAVLNEAKGAVLTVIDIPAGTYKVSSPLLLNSKTILDDRGVTFSAGSDWNLAKAGRLGFTIVANVDWADATKCDVGIQVRDMYFDWNGVDTPGGASVRFNYAKDVFAADDTFVGNEDGTAFMGVDGAVVLNCRAVGTTNYGFDNWDGPKNTVIRNSTVQAARFGGIALTGQPTDPSLGATASANSVTGNTVYGADRIGIDVDALNAASKVENTFVAGNTISGPGRGIEVLGPSSYAQIYRNSISGSMGGQSIIIANQTIVDQVYPDSVYDAVVFNHVSSSFIASPAIAAVAVQAAHTKVIGNEVSETQAPSSYWLSGTDILAAENLASADSAVSDQSFWGSGISDEDTLNSRALTSSRPYQPPSGTTPSVSAIPSPLPNIAMYGAVATDSQVVSNGENVSPKPAGSQIVVANNEAIVSSIGKAIFYVSGQSENASIDGGLGKSEMIVTGGDNDGSFTMGSDVTNIDVVKVLLTYPGICYLYMNSTPDLQAYASDGGMTIVANGWRQGVHPGAGVDCLVGYDDGSTSFQGRTVNFNGDTISNLRPGDAISFDDLSSSAYWNVGQDPSGAGSLLVVNDGWSSAVVKLTGTFYADEFSAQGSGGLGLTLRMA